MAIFDPNKVYIIFDGTSHYAIYGCDIETEIADYEEVVDGPFDEWNDEVNNIVMERNYYTSY